MHVDPPVEPRARPRVGLWATALAALLEAVAAGLHHVGPIAALLEAALSKLS